MPERRDFLTPTWYVDSDAPEARTLARRFLAKVADDRPQSKAVALFEGVRDTIRYDPYSISLTPHKYHASSIAKQSAAFCVPKAILLAAVARASGIPAGVGFADVRNHLNSPRLRTVMDTDLFIYHGYVSLWLDGRWVKVTPAFNMELCQRFGVRPPIFDGRNDALFHEYDAQDRRHMEYVNDRGFFVEPPIEQMLRDFTATYPNMTRLLREQGSLAADDATFRAPSFK
jgi:transglutaminase-like putative cysteine protease